MPQYSAHADYGKTFEVRNGTYRTNAEGLGAATSALVRLKTHCDLCDLAKYFDFSWIGVELGLAGGGRVRLQHQPVVAERTPRAGIAIPMLKEVDGTLKLTRPTTSSDAPTGVVDYDQRTGRD